MNSEFLPDTPYADTDGGTIRASADALWILAVCGKLARIWMDDLDEILSDDEPVKAAVPWKNCWNQNGAATEVSWSCSLCVYSVSRPATFVGRRQLSFSKVDHIRTKHEGLVLVAGRFCSCASLATSRKMAVQRFHIERPTGTGTSSAWA